MPTKHFFLLLSPCLLLMACQSSAPPPNTADTPLAKPLLDAAVLEQIFSQNAAEGTFVLHQLHNKSSIVHNPARADSALLPASTFKIPNSLIILETGVVKDEQEILPWDGQERMVKAWNQDHNLQSALKV